ncbi:YndM family protein [Virgibacillus sp. DJP39]|uniref:YndM family protein n=1 Tax=Virgibacillus sp. DJP39 TaxID=3409790 RepID=UPI003BB4BB3D
MEHLKAIIIKFVVVTAVLFVVLSLLFGVDFGEVLLISIVLTGASYLIGDLFVLPKTSNTVATLSDLGLAFFVIWIVGGGVIEEEISLVMASIISAIGIAAGEMFFHMYMEKDVLEQEHQRESNRMPRQEFSTEFAEEDSPEIKKDRHTSNDDELK